MKKNYTPVILFVFKREEHTEKCLWALNQNDEAKYHDLYIFADGARNQDEIKEVETVRALVHDFVKHSNFKRVIIEESSKNKGLAKSIIEGVSEIINQYGKAIVVEDDLITAPDFLTYMENALDFYREDKKVGSISGSTYPIKELLEYPFDVYAIKKGEGWGWGTWAEVWNQVDWEVKEFEEYFSNKRLRREFDSLEYGLDNMLCNQMSGKIDSWAVRWCYFLFRNDLLTIYPRESKALNIGLDGSGTHCNQDFKLDKGFGRGKYVEFIPAKYSERLAKKVAIYERSQLNLLDRIWIKFISIVKLKR